MEKAFPEVSFDGKRGTITLNYESMNYSTWPASVSYQDIAKLALDDHGTLEMNYGQSGKQKLKIALKDFGTRQQEVLDAINRYYSRYLHAVAYQEQKRAAT